MLDRPFERRSYLTGVTAPFTCKENINKSYNIMAIATAISIVIIIAREVDLISPT
jgi:hypothetical protein